MERAVKVGLLRYGNRGFSRTVAGSLAAHVVVLVLAFFVYRGPRRYLVPQVYTVNLVEPGGGPGAAARPVEMKPMEEKPAVQKASAPPKKATVKEAVPHPARQAVKTVRAARPEAGVSARDAVLVNARLKKIKEQVRRKEGESFVESRVRQFKEKEDRTALERRVAEFKKGLSAGQGAAKGGEGHGTGGAESGSGGGISRGNVDSRYKAYYSEIRDKVQAAWIYPEGFENMKGAIIVSVRIDRSGRLLDSWVNESSGNPNFDASLMDAIKKASPFPPLPSDFEGPYLETGFRFCHPQCG